MPLPHIFLARWPPKVPSNSRFLSGSPASKSSPNSVESWPSAASMQVDFQLKHNKKHGCCEMFIIPYHPCMLCFIYLQIPQKNQPNVGKYTIHGWYMMVWVSVLTIDMWHGRLTKCRLVYFSLPLPFFQKKHGHHLGVFMFAPSSGNDPISLRTNIFRTD